MTPVPMRRASAKHSNAFSVGAGRGSYPPPLLGTASLREGNTIAGTKPLQGIELLVRVLLPGQHIVIAPVISHQDCWVEVQDGVNALGAASTTAGSEISMESSP